MMYGFITSEMFWGGLRILRRAVLTDTATTSSAILDDSIYFSCFDGGKSQMLVGK